MRILIVEDDRRLAASLSEALQDRGYIVDVVHDGETALTQVNTVKCDLVLLDIWLPKMNGIQLCQGLRSRGNRVPILMITAADSNSDQVLGLDSGADDFLVKPIGTDVLTARIRALLRRGTRSVSPVLTWENLSFERNQGIARYEDKPLPLTAKELALLELLLEGGERLLTYNEIVDSIWILDNPPTEDTVRSHIKSIRSKLKMAGAPNYIETVYGRGFRLRPAA